MGTGSRLWGSVRSALVENIGALVIRALGSTLRVRRIGTENIERARVGRDNILFALWHGRLLSLTYVHKNQGIIVLVSRHRDGEYIARIIGKLGFGAVRGSSTRGGTPAVLSMLSHSAEHSDLAITPDGPRGPRERCQTGVVYVAKKAGLPVIPIGTSSRPRLVLRSWDRFLVPLPFARCVVVYGEPAYYDGNLDDESMEAARADLDTRLKLVTEEADRACGYPAG